MSIRMADLHRGNPWPFTRRVAGGLGVRDRPITRRVPGRMRQGLRCTSWGFRMPTTTLAPTGWRRGKWIAAAGSVFRVRDRPRPAGVPAATGRARPAGSCTSRCPGPPLGREGRGRGVPRPGGAGVTTIPAPAISTRPLHTARSERARARARRVTRWGNAARTRRAVPTTLMSRMWLLITAAMPRWTGEPHRRKPQALCRC
jgi:hypothetical protein